MKDLPHSSSDLEKIYRERFAGVQNYRAKVWKTLCAQFFARWISPDAVILDLGCGYCEFINNISAAQKYGMDLNPDARNNAAPDVAVFQQDTSAEWPVPEGALDVVFTSNFLEHLPTKTHLESTLRHAFRSLKPGGRFIAMGPNIKYVPGAYWDFIDHHIALTELSMAEVLQKSGFSVEKVVPRFLPYTMSGNTTYPLWMLRLYLAMPLAWPVFGKQFLVVARKP
jgi:SAM-dependent methyltransferase